MTLEPYKLRPVKIVRGFEIVTGMTIELIDGSWHYVFEISHSVDVINILTPGRKAIELDFDQGVFLIG